MDGEHRRHKRAGPEFAGHPPQDEEEHDRRGGVKQHAGQMVPPRLEAVELAVRHVRKPGQPDANCCIAGW